MSKYMIIAYFIKKVKYSGYESLKLVSRLRAYGFLRKIRWGAQNILGFRASLGGAEL